MKHVKRITALLLIAVLILASLAGCGTGGQDGINRAAVTFPEASEAEQAVDVTAALSVNYYLVARAYLDEFLAFDTENMDAESAKEFTELLSNAIAAFEDVEKLSGALEDAVNVWEATPENGKPSMKMISSAGAPSGLVATAYAASDSPAQK